MKILMFGRGVINTLYGWAFKEAGHHVDFYVRPGRAKDFGSMVSLDICDARKNFPGTVKSEQWQTNLREELAPGHDYDIIVACVQFFHLSEAIDFLSNRLSNATLVLFSQFWDDPAEITKSLPPDRLVLGFPSAGGSFRSNDKLVGSLLKQVQLGISTNSKRDLAVEELFTSAGFEAARHCDLRGWFYIHFICSAGLLGQVWSSGSASLFSSSKECREALLSVRELLPLVEARGIDPKKHCMEILPFVVPAVLMGPVFKLSINMEPVRRNLVTPNAQEIEHTCVAVLNTAKALGISVPRLERNVALGMARSKAS